MTKILTTDLKKKYLIVTLILVFLIPVIELWVLTFIIVPTKELQVEVGWQDLSLRSSYESPGWLCQDFTEGWRVIVNTHPATSGFEVRNGLGVLFADFKGEPTRIEIERSLDNIDTSVYPYLVITHKEDVPDGAINLSFGIIDKEGNFHDGGWYHVSTNWTNLEFDLRKLYNGTITKISIRLTNDFDTRYAGGVRHAYIKLIAIYEYAPEWRIISNRPLEAELHTHNGVLTISTLKAVPLNSIVAAQKVGGFDFNLEVYGYLKVSIKTSSLHVAARIVVWTEDSKDHLILLKTYNDNSWHTEVIHLRSFGVYGSRIVMLQLSFVVIELGGPLPQVSYKELSFIRWISGR